MKVFPVTTDQLKQIKDAQAAVATVQKPYQDAQAALRAIVAGISGDAQVTRGWGLSDDGTSLVIL